jgi:hypothetical protein
MPLTSARFRQCSWANAMGLARAHGAWVVRTPDVGGARYGLGRRGTRRFRIRANARELARAHCSRVVRTADVSRAEYILRRRATCWFRIRARALAVDADATWEVGTRLVPAALVVRRWLLAGLGRGATASSIRLAEGAGRVVAVQVLVAVDRLARECAHHAGIELSFRARRTPLVSTADRTRIVCTPQVAAACDPSILTLACRIGITIVARDNVEEERQKKQQPYFHEMLRQRVVVVVVVVVRGNSTQNLSTKMSVVSRGKLVLKGAAEAQLE